MTIGSWQPDPSPKTLSFELLRLALAVNTDEFPNQPLDNLMPLQTFMTAEQTTWNKVLNDFDVIQLKHLCQFFTLAEHHWSGWFAGDKNPVIWICKHLKKHNAFPDKALTQWIKQHSDNRFLPYGNPLL